MASIDYKKVSANELHAYFAEILPNYDRDRVHASDIKKLLSWYNILVSNGITDFVEQNAVATEEPAAEEGNNTFFIIYKTPSLQISNHSQGGHFI